MKHLLGYSDYQLRHKGTKEPVVMDTSRLLNGHALICGMSGSGKSYQVQAMLTSGAKQGVEFDILDVHNELDVPGTTPVLYSAATRYGFNPMVLNADPHSGGVLAKINELVAMVNASTSVLGPQQEGTLRALLEDLYQFNGITDDDPRTWHRAEITEAQRAQLLAEKNTAALRECYPTLEDLIEYTRRRRDACYIGADTAVMRALEAVNKSARKLRIKHKALRKAGGDTSELEVHGLKKALDEAKEEARLAFENYVNRIETGHELRDHLKYPSGEVLSSLYTRLRSLNASGTLRSNPPPFGAARVRCHQVKHLSDAEQRMFVYRRLTEIFRQRRDAGIQSDVVHVIVLDEAAKFFSKEHDNIINVIAKEGRKFGLALWCCSQSPTSFPEDFLVNVGTIMLLGLSDADKDRVGRTWRVDTKALDYIAARKVACVKFARAGETSSKFQNIVVSEAYANEMLNGANGGGGGNVTHMRAGRSAGRKWS